jgi:hypothetical protein
MDARNYSRRHIPADTPPFLLRGIFRNSSFSFLSKRSKHRALDTKQLVAFAYDTSGDLHRDYGVNFPDRRPKCQKNS